VAQIILTKQQLMDCEEPSISGFMVFKEIKDNQEFKVEEAISLASKYFNEHNPSKVFELIKKDND
jgi:hypothetical protein